MIDPLVNKIVIELTEEDSRLFMEFQKRYQFIKALEDEKVFTLRSGSVEVHFNNIGEIASISIQKHIKLIS